MISRASGSLVIFVVRNPNAELTPVEYRGGRFDCGEAKANMRASSRRPVVARDVPRSGERWREPARAAGRRSSRRQTYRYHGHFGADDPLAYRTQEEEDYYEARDCINAMVSYLVENDVASQAEIDAIDSVALADVEESIKFADESPFPDDGELTTDVYISYA